MRRNTDISSRLQWAEYEGAMKQLILGTALWGWSVNRETAFALLDAFYSRGFRWVDTAANYPIDKNQDHLGLAEKFLAQWLAAHGVRDLRVVAKIGSVSNDGGPAADLSPARIERLALRYHSLFEGNLAFLSVHWDNRDKPEDIAATLEALSQAGGSSVIGLSGILHPEVYAGEGRRLKLRFITQAKHNVFVSDLPRYAPLAQLSSFWVYGLNCGGLGFSPGGEAFSSMSLRQVKNPLAGAVRDSLLRFSGSAEKEYGIALGSFNRLGMAFAYGSPGVDGLIIGPSKVSQFEESAVCFADLSRCAGVVRLASAIARAAMADSTQ